MELSYWRSKWRKGTTGFHMKDGYPGLEKYWDSLPLKDNPVVLVPLCGKTVDLLWLAGKCRRVIGVEISEIAVQDFLTENNLQAVVSSFAGFKLFQTGNIDIWQGDFFKLPKHKLPAVDLIYDKAALIALPPEMRKRYVAKVIGIVSGHTQILLHLLNYRVEEMTGPPFSVSVEEINMHFGKKFTFQNLIKRELNIEDFKKFQNRGLHSYFIEILLLLLPKKKNKQT